MRKLSGFVLALLLTSLPAMAESTNDPGQPESDLKVRCFEETDDDDQLVQSFTAIWCEEIGDSVPYFSLGRMVSPRDIYNSSADLKCLDKPKLACISCLNKWRADYTQMLTLMVTNKMISPQNRNWMLKALKPFYKELRTGC